MSILDTSAKFYWAAQRHELGVMKEFFVTFVFILFFLLVTFALGTGIILGGFILLKVWPPLAFVWWLVAMAVVLAYLEVRHG